MTPAVDELVNAHVRVALAGARAARRRYPEDGDDLLSDALLALFAAARTYDPARGDFARWAAFRVRADLLEGIRNRLGRAASSPRRAFRARLVPLRPAGRGVDFRPGVANDEPADRGPTPLEAATARDFDALLAGLRAESRYVLTAHYRLGLNLREIAQGLGLCRSRVSQIRSAALAFLRQRLARRGVTP